MRKSLYDANLVGLTGETNFIQIFLSMSVPSMCRRVFIRNAKVMALLEFLHRQLFGWLGWLVRIWLDHNQTFLSQAHL